MLIPWPLAAQMKEQDRVMTEISDIVPLLPIATRLLIFVFPTSNVQDSNTIEVWFPFEILIAAVVDDPPDFK
jgi:hypothetical protein